MNPGVSLWLVLSLLVTTQAANNPEVSWGDWLVMDEAEPGTSILLRRITPKSVFVAPTFNGCSEGYTQDTLGRCVKVVKVNQKAQWDFFLERINSMYAPSSTSKKPQKEAGPFHINLPLGSESSQEDGIVRKRVPPIIREDIIRKPVVRVHTTTFPPPTTTEIPEETTLEVSTLPTTIDCCEITTTESRFYSGSTNKPRRTEPSVMLADQPDINEGNPGLKNLELPIPRKEINSTNRSEKPFVIIVTNDPTAPEESATTYKPITTTEEITSDTQTDISTEGTTEIDSSDTSDFDGSDSETKDIIETSIRPLVKNDFPFTIRPKCDMTVDSSDCSQSTERTYNTRKVSSSVPPYTEFNTPVRFPSESVIVPVHKTQSFVRFPGVTNPHDDRPNFWWPSWQVRQHPGIHGWPPSDVSSEQALRHQYPPYTYTWSDSTAWRRRFFQRD